MNNVDYFGLTAWIERMNGDNGKLFETSFSTNALQVAKWDNAFPPITGDPFQFQTPDFINGDDDRFRVRVTDAGRTNAASVTVRLCTSHPTLSGYDTAWRTLTLVTNTTPGVFISTNLLLVSDHEDASFNPAQHNAAPNSPDRIFKAQLGSDVRAEYRSGEISTHTAEATVGVNVKTVVVDVAAMVGVQQGINITDVLAVQFTRMGERLAQANIAVEEGGEAWFNPPAGINLGQWQVWASSNGVDRLTPEARAILAAAAAALPPNPTNPKHLRVVVVPSLRAPDVPPPKIVLGYAIAPNGFPHPDDAVYHGYCFLSITGILPFVTVHEVLHILPDGGHDPVPWNIMWEYADQDTGVKGKKRLRYDQETAIRANGKAYFK